MADGLGGAHLRRGDIAQAEPQAPRREAGAPAGSLPCNVDDDVALVFEGGGYRAAYTAGFPAVLLEHGIHFAHVYGISAGASHAVDYVSRDLWRTSHAFIDLTDKRPEAGGVRSLLMGRGYFNADYDYVGCVEDGVLPFDFDTFRASAATVEMQAFAAETGEDVTYTKADMPDTVSLMNRVRASSTLPGIMNPTQVDGLTMYDGALGTGGGLATHLAERDGHTRMVVVLSRVRGYRKPPTTERERRLYRAVSHGFDSVYRAICDRPRRYNSTLDHLMDLERQGRALLVYPEVMPVKNTTIDTPRLVEAYRLGHAQYERELPRVLEFLGM